MLNMLHIGASRAGSTWLWRALNRHPQTVFPIWGPNAPSGRKTGWFWNNTSSYWKDNHHGKLKPRAVTTLDEYREYYDPTEDGKVKIDITEGAAYIPESRIRLIKETYPDVKVTYCIRNPITTLWSHIKYAGGANGDIQGFFTSNGGNYIKNIEYIKNIKIWKRHFPEEQFMVYFFSDIKDNPIDLLKRLSENLDIDPKFWDTDSLGEIQKKQNPNRNEAVLSNANKQIIINRCSDLIRQVELYFDVDLAHWYEGKE